MEFLGMGFGEILLILLIALLLFGPGRITEISKTLGKTARSFKNSTSNLTAQITKELEDEKKSKPPPSGKS
jgi:TatA/E family protein of Tat protein translocase